MAWFPSLLSTSEALEGSRPRHHPKVDALCCCERGFTRVERGYVKEFEGLLSLQFVGSVGVLGPGAAPVHPALAEPLDKESLRGQPQEHAPLQVTEEAVHGFGQVQREGEGGRRGEADQLGAARPVDVFVSQGDLALQDEAPLRGLGGHLHHWLAMVQQHHLQAKICPHTYTHTHTHKAAGVKGLFAFSSASIPHLIMWKPEGRSWEEPDAVLVASALLSHSTCAPSSASLRKRGEILVTT